MRTVIFIVLACSITMQLYSQTEYRQTIRGRVTDRNTKTPLPGATVLLLGSGIPVGTSTDNDGFFRLPDLAIGRQGIQVSFIGYEPVRLTNLQLSSGKELVLNIEMEEKIITTEEVVVTAHQRKDQPLNEMATVSARSFSVEETQRYAGSLGDPSRMAANFAGINSANDRRNDIVIRGNSPSGLLWRLDGIDIPNPNHFGALGTTGGPVSILNNNLLTNSDFYSGAFPAEFGNALAGAFDLKLRSGNNEKHEFTGQVGFNGFEFGAEGPFKKDGQASYMAYYRYSTLGVLNALGVDFGTGNSIPQYQDLTFKLDFPRSPIGRISLFGMGGKSYIDLKNETGYGTENTYTKYGSDMGVIGLTHLYFFNDKNRITTKFSVSGIHTYTILDSIAIPVMDSLYPYYRSKFTEVRYTASSTFNSKINKKNSFSIGLTFNLFTTNYIDSVWEHDNQKFRSITNNKGNVTLTQGFVQWQHKFSNTLVLNSGIYSQFFGRNDEFSFEPRLGIKWNIFDNQAINLGFGMHSQTQPLINYFVVTEMPDGSFAYTNKKLGFSKSIHFVVGYDYLITENLRLKFESYYQYLYNIPVSQSYPQFSMLNYGDFFSVPRIDSLLNKGTGKNYGIELTLERFFIGGYYFLITSSLYNARYTGYDGVERNSLFNGNYIINTLFGYEYKLTEHNAFALDMKLMWGGNKRYVPIDIAQSMIKHDTEYDWTHAYEHRYPDYFRLDVRLSYKLNGKFLNQEWAFDVQNLTNRKNILVETFDYSPLDSQQSKIVKVYQVGFFPMITWRIQF
ncbi:MAG: TonB-dependent receptor [Bacteroidia bacterium]|nr:TonB-dependent receptor [Bacteroidia bacterium]